VSVSVVALRFRVRRTCLWWCTQRGIVSLRVRLSGRCGELISSHGKLRPTRGLLRDRTPLPGSATSQQPSKPTGHYGPKRATSTTRRGGTVRLSSWSSKGKRGSLSSSSTSPRRMRAGTRSVDRVVFKAAMSTKSTSPNRAHLARVDQGLRKQAHCGQPFDRL